MKPKIATSTILILFLIAGGTWTSLSRFLPDGTPRTVVLVALAIVFVALYAWRLVRQIRTLLGDPDHVVKMLVLLLFDLAVLLVGFGWVYRQFGIIDGTAPGQPVIHDFATCIYYSVVTFTTLGYGDFYPYGPARILAAIEALTGYLILGILVSSAATLLSPRNKPHIGETEFE